MYISISEVSVNKFVSPSPKFVFSAGQGRSKFLLFLVININMGYLFSGQWDTESVQTIIHKPLHFMQRSPDAGFTYSFLMIPTVSCHSFCSSLIFQLFRVKKAYEILDHLSVFSLGLHYFQVELCRHKAVLMASLKIAKSVISR